MMTDQAMTSALESVERMQKQMDQRQDKIIVEGSFDMTQAAIADALDSIRRLNEKIEGKKQQEAASQQRKSNNLILQDRPQETLAPSFISNQQQSPYSQH
jgi:hypothetical protein